MLAFSVRTLLAVVAVATVAISALIQRTPIWTSALVSLAMALFMVAAILAILRPATRTFWLPVAMIGWTYLAIVFVQPLAGLHRMLITARLVAKIGLVSLPEEDVPFLDFEIALADASTVEVTTSDPSARTLRDNAGSSRPRTGADLSESALIDSLLFTIFMGPLSQSGFDQFYFIAQTALGILLAFGGGLFMQLFLPKRLMGANNTPIMEQTYW